MAQATTNIVAGTDRTYAGPPNLTAGTFVVQGASDGVIALPSGANQQAIGVITDSDLVGAGVYNVRRFGESYAICGAALVAPGYFKLDANGHAVPTTAAGDNIAGFAVSSTVNALDEFVAFVAPSIR
jgi:hypothetical protein